MSTVATEIALAAGYSEIPAEQSAPLQPQVAPQIPAWKREVTEKLSAARARRQAGIQAHPVGEDSAAEPDAADAEASARARASRVAATVAARYAQAPSYREYLASEVRAAVAAAVEVQVKASEAERVQEQEQKSKVIEAESNALPAPFEQATPLVPRADRPKAARRQSVPPMPQPPRVDHAASGFRYAGPTPAASVPAQQPAHHVPEYSTATRGHAASPLETEREAIKQNSLGDAFTDPLADALITPATPLPANLLEFPRELIAARKARPRHAEGPLRNGAPEEPQLRIFEVEANAVSTQVEVPQATEWSSIRLGAHPEQFPDEPADVAYASHTQSSHRAQGGTETFSSRNRSFASEPLPEVAGIADRLMAALVDISIVGIAFLLFVLVFAASTAHPPAGRPVLIGGAVVLAMLYLGYQLLFFTFAEGTPGMRYARIALCTFDDENPSREAMRKRILALLLAAAPLGLGFLYVLFDEDTLGWHDRMTRMYQRTYK